MITLLTLGMTPLAAAASKGHLETVRLLIKNKAYIGSDNPNNPDTKRQAWPEDTPNNSKNDKLDAKTIETLKLATKTKSQRMNDKGNRVVFYKVGGLLG